MDRKEAIHLLRRYIHDTNLVKHCLATGAVMKATAVRLGEPAFAWEEIGILHDIDFELVEGDMQRHGVEAERILLANGIGLDYAEIIRRHNHLLFAGTYDRPVELALQAADSVSGLIIACALVKGGRLSEVEAKTVAKKAKDKRFAAGCDRGRIALASRLMDISEFYSTAIAGLLGIRDELDLA
jgi:putative nucleotidyltransferase with HDIG domain